MAQLLIAAPEAGISALVGILFLATASVALGITSGTPKTFVGLSLALWYVALNAKGHTPALDYGGWWASATPLAQAGWAGAAVVAMVAAMAAHRARMTREG